MNLPEGFEIDEDIAPAPEGFEIDPPKSLGGFAKNLGHDVVDTAKGIGNLGVGLVTNPVDTVINTATHLPRALMDEGKRLGIGELITGHPINAGEKFLGAAYDKPLTTFLDVLPAAGAAGKVLGFGGKAAKGATLASEAANLTDDVARSATSTADDVARMAPAGAPEAINLGDEAAQILKEPIKPPEVSYTPPAPGSANVPPQAPALGVEGIVDKTVSHLGEKARTAIKGPLDEVNSFLSERYQKVAQKPEFGRTIGDMMTRKAQSLRFKEMGASPGQIRRLVEKMGEDKVRALSDLAEEKGITQPIRGYTVGKNIEKMGQDSGRMTGGIREIATKRGAVHDTKALVDEIRSQLDSKYLKGGTSGSEKGNYIKALKDIENTPPTADSLAKRITELNSYATKNQMVQKKGAFTDVANAASRINNKLIEKYLSPAELEAYTGALRDFGASEIFKKFYSFRAGRELAGRSSGLGGMWGEAKNFVADIGGNKMLEKTFDKLGNKLKKNPDIAKSLGSLSEEALSDILSSLDEVIDEGIK